MALDVETIEEPSAGNDAINDDDCNMDNNATLPSCSQITVISDIKSAHDAEVKEIDIGEECVRLIQNKLLNNKTLV